MLRIKFCPKYRENMYFFTEKDFDDKVAIRLLKEDKLVEIRAIEVPKRLKERIHRGEKAELILQDEVVHIILSCVRGIVEKENYIKIFFVQPIWDKNDKVSRYLQDIQHNEEVIENYKMFVDWLRVTLKM